MYFLYRTVIENLSVESSKLYSTCPGENFQRKTLLENFRNFNFSSDFERKGFNSWAKTFCLFLSNYLLHVQGNIFSALMFFRNFAVDAARIGKSRRKKLHILRERFFFRKMFRRKVITTVAAHLWSLQANVIERKKYPWIIKRLTETE